MNAALHAQRRRGIGGSDAAAVVGRSRYQDPLGLWLEKTGRVPAADVDTKATARGRRLEDYVLDEYAATTGAILVRGEALLLRGPFRHPQHAWMLANPDALVSATHHVTRSVRGIECVGGADAKTASGAAAYAWGREGTDEIPDEYLFQGLHYAAVFRVPWWDFPVLIGGDRFEFRTYRVQADPQVLAWLIEQERRFWVEHVLADVPPEGGSAASRQRFAEAKHPHPTDRMLVTEDERALELVGRLAVADRAQTAADAEYASAKADVCALIGAHEGIATSLGTVTWRASRRGHRLFKTSFSKEC